MVRRSALLIGAFLAAAFLAGTAAAQDDVTREMERFVVEAPGGRPVVFRHAPSDSGIARALARTAETFIPAPVAALELPPDSLVVVIAPSEAAFGILTGGHVPDWGLAVAFPHLRRVVIRSPRLTGRVPVDPATVLRHELAHVYLAEAAGPQAPLPRWFHEGFAALYADEWRWVAPARLAWARVTKRLAPLALLADSIPTTRDPGAAYVQSMAAVRNLRERGGDEGVAQFLGQIRAGATFDGAMRATYGLTLAQFYAAWDEELGGYGWLLAVTDERGLWIAIAIFVALLYVFRRRSIRREIARRRAAEDRALGDPDDHSLGVEEQDRYWEQDDEAWRGDDEDETPR